MVEKKIIRGTKHENKSKIEDYLNFKMTSVSDTRTLGRYRYFLKIFLEQINKDTKDITETDVIEAVNKMAKNYKVGSMNDVKILVKSFLYWRYDDIKVRFRNLDKICKGMEKGRTYNPSQMLSKEDIEKLVQTEEEVRWKAFFMLYFYGGFRPGEVCNLKWKDITFDADGGAFITLLAPKTKKNFDKYVPENVCFYLKKLMTNNSQYVFPTKRTKMKVAPKKGEAIPVGDKPMTTSGVWQHLVPLAKRVFGKHVNPYILRHSIATILYNRDDLKDDLVAKQMGHSVSMKETYNNLSMEKIKEQMKRIHIEAEDLPVEKKKELENRIEKLEEIINQITKGKMMLLPHLDENDKVVDYEVLPLEK